MAVPKINSITPNHGVAGNSVIIAGENLVVPEEDPVVTFGGLRSPFLIVATATEIQAVVPPAIDEINFEVGVFVKTSQGQNVEPGIWTYDFIHKPKISHIDPVRGPVGQRVEIFGHYLTDTGGVAIGGQSCSGNNETDNEIYAIVPDLAPGQYKLYSFTSEGNSNEVDFEVISTKEQEQKLAKGHWVGTAWH